MNPSNDSKTDRLDDRLMDLALREAIGGETPPDLADQILAAVEKQASPSPKRKEPVMDKPKRRKRWIVGTVAACLVAGVACALTLPELFVRPKLASSPSVEATRADLSAPDSDDPSGLVLPTTVQQIPNLDALVVTGEESMAEPTPEVPSGTSHSHTPPWIAATPPAILIGEDESVRAQDGVGLPTAALNAYGEGTVFVKRGAPYDEQLAPGSSDSNDMTGRSLTLDIPGEAVHGLEMVAPNDYFAQNLQFGSRTQNDRQPGVEMRESSNGTVWLNSEINPDTPSGTGPGRGGDRYDNLVENAFRAVKDHPLSTFSIDVDTASYANVRRFLLAENRLPPPDAVRIEEMVNYFDYDYAGPTDDVPFAAHIAAAGCPWSPDHRLVRVALKGKTFPAEDRPESNLVFLLDVSGSMNSPDKLPLVKEGMKLLAEQMRENDRVAIVVYASAQGLALPSTSGANREQVIAALDRLQAGGSTNGGAGIELAYQIARDNFIPGGVNRVILCTDGDFNVGTTSTGDLVRMVEERARSGVFLSILGFGRGNLNDAMVEQLSNKGNGNYAYIDSLNEAHKVLVEQMGGTLVTIAKDVKIQIEFNPAQVAAYRLIGYENRVLAAEDFNDDKKDAGEIGAGHTVTALYEIVPAGTEIDVPSVDPLKYQPAAAVESRPEEYVAGDAPNDDSAPGLDALSNKLMTLKLRYKEPDGDTSRLLTFPFTDEGQSFAQADADMQFASAVASFGMLLRGSQFKGDTTYDAVLEIAESAKGLDPHGYRTEFLAMVRRAEAMMPSHDRR